MLHTYETGVAPFLLFRVAGKDTSGVDSLQINRTVALLEEADRLESIMESLRETIDASLYRLVPTMTDEEKGLLRQLLKLKRDIFNGRASAVEAHVQSEIRGRLDIDEAEQLRKWLEASSERERLLREAKETFEREIAEAGHRLAEQMGNPECQKGLVLASPEYVRSYNRHRLNQWLPKNQYARSSTAYVSRMVTKTSPFSTLTAVGMTWWESDPRNSLTDDESKRSVCRISQAVAAGIVFQLVKDDEFVSLFTYEKNPSIRLENGKVSYSKSTYSVLNGFSWRQDQYVSLALGPDEFEMLRQLRSGTYAEMTEQFTRESEWFQRFIREQWIRPVLPYSRKEPYPLRVLAERLRLAASRRGRRITRLIRLIDGCERRMEISGVKRRLRLQDQIRDAVASISDCLNQPVPDTAKKGNLVYEDVRTGRKAPPLGEHVKEDLTRLGEMMRPYFFRTHMYDLLVEHFVERYGRGGICFDIEDFIRSFEGRKDRPRLVKRAQSLDKQTAAALEEGRVFASVSNSAAPPNTTVFFQLASPSGFKGIQHGDYSLVVNQFNPGFGGLFVRFLRLFDGPQENLPARLREWIQSMYPKSRIVDFPSIADYNSLQLDYGVTEQALRWPAEHPTTERLPDVMLSDLRLVHTEEGTLTLLDENGTVVAPQYLGTVPYYLLQGTVSHFLTLIAPWVNAFPVGWSASMLHGTLPPPERLEYHPRREEGRLVLRRARWRVPLYLFPLREPGETDYAYFCRVKRWQKENGIPDEVFLSGERSRFSFEAKKRKPMWLSFNSFHSIEAAVQSVVQDDLLCVSLTEALPARSEHWFEDEDGLRYATEYVSLLKWPRDQEAQWAVAQAYGMRGE